MLSIICVASAGISVKLPPNIITSKDSCEANYHTKKHMYMLLKSNLFIVSIAEIPV